MLLCFLLFLLFHTLNKEIAFLKVSLAHMMSVASATRSILLDSCALRQ